MSLKSVKVTNSGDVDLMRGGVFVSASQTVEADVEDYLIPHIEASPDLSVEDNTAVEETDPNSGEEEGGAPAEQTPPETPAPDHQDAAAVEQQNPDQASDFAPPEASSEAQPEED